MRDIRFRAWDKSERVWIKNVYIHIDGRINSLGTGPLDFKSGEDIVINQYTGLKDKNGVEIYEGDIVELTLDVDRAGAEDRYYNLESCAVVWSEKDGCWDAGDRRLSTYVDDEDWEHRSEVVGNIYENPELLE